MRSCEELPIFYGGSHRQGRAGDVRDDHGGRRRYQGSISGDGEPCLAEQADMTAGIELHFIDRQSSGTDQTAVHTTNRDAGATFGECLADLRPYEDDTGGGNPGRDEGLYENMRG